ncbi:MAG: MBL fold metallo-hydrolase [Candidatus Melainabacteria bacterium]|nr:MBL fold metallo-hydrolase [Candidatus Melainabacteria bacterium]
MANPNKRLQKNVEGDFFVDSTCINCDTCRQLAPHVFSEFDDHSFVYAQPQNKNEKQLALRALLSCPTGSIGTTGTKNVKDVMEDFPLTIDNGVYYCGFNSPKSFGANSYFIQHTDGNWLVDSPKFTKHLVKAFGELGGLRYIFLTHQDDVADADKFALEFDSQRIIHQEEVAAQPDAEIILQGLKPVRLFPDFLAIPTPGHTKGHCLLLYKDCFLFTGDHLYWDRQTKRLEAWQDYCWYSWSELTKSMALLVCYNFQWILPGHGQRISLAPHAMHQQLLELVSRMQSTSASQATIGKL